MLQYVHQLGANIVRLLLRGEQVVYSGEYMSFLYKLKHLPAAGNNTMRAVSLQRLQSLVTIDTSKILIIAALK